ncbi:MFS transporter [Nocardioides szechwanensis]|uniref:Drug resistance transporter, EmrB/QacA subfamily n=1 Tax=Nocardioides szechwanensis TaxID=1005944 RepID=A0A1H0K5D7_9ACTN|nr:MFS transporter [Nocardioides szechwanensis]GEP35412.1 MFS transporter [Nocardioides szechwanensis]SDO51002.1 drug resistance transporter, EmrB/QacA subfamily [Nocardioides szechwanensis]
MSSTSSPAETVSSRRWLALGLIAAAQFMVIMDTSIIGVALPEMQADLGFTPEGLSWVFNAYVVAFGGLLLLGGRLSDLFGARRIFSIGWGLLAVGSVMAGLADGVAVELAGRAVQGAGSALIAPAALTLLFTIFGATPKELTKALALYGAAAPAGGTAGVFLGGVLTEYASWPWVFFINLPLAAVVLLLTPSVMPKGMTRSGSLDLAGAVTVTAGLAAVVFAIVRAPEVGWVSASTLVTGVAGLALLVLFVVFQARRREPLMRLGILKAPNLAAANVAQFMLGAAWIPMFFFVNLYLQQVVGLGAFASGAALLPLTVTIMVGMVGAAPRLIARFGPKAMTVSGLATLSVGLVWLSFIQPDGSFVRDVLPASLVAAAGMAMAFIPSLGLALTAAAPEEGGLASGIVSTSYQIGSALGLALMTAVASAFGADRVGDAVSQTEGWSAGLLGAAGTAALGALLAVAWLRRPQVPDEAVQETSDAVA